MKVIPQIATLILFIFQVHSQNCYVKDKGLLDNDFSDIWIGKTFQGTIGTNNQRIEIRYTNISKVNDTTYYVTGKSKVKSNICDFTGKLMINNSYKLDMENPECGRPDYSAGYLTGKYVLNEDETQSHVGEFFGDFKAMYDESSNGFVINSGWYGQENVSEFIGKWKKYDKKISKYCSWGIQIPPTEFNNLFKHYDNEFYLFNYKYLNNGWKTYVLSSLNSFVTIPKDFESNKTRKTNDFMSFPKQEIEESRKKEKEIWWK